MLTTTRHIPSPPTADQARQLLRDIDSGTCPTRPRRVDRPLILYGAGNLGRMAFEHLRHIGVPVAAVVDAAADRLRDDPYWHGVDLRTPDAATGAERERSLLAVSVANHPFAPIEESLRTTGWRDIVPFYDIAEAYRDAHPLSNGWFCPPLTAGELRDTDDVLDRWADDISRAHHLQFIAWRRIRQEWRFDGAPVDPSDRFFIPEITRRLTGDERFLDVGAHTGSVSARFADVTGGHFGDITAIEPDPVNLADLEPTLHALRRRHGHPVRLIQAVVAEAAGQGRFAAGLGYASQLAGTGTMAVPVTTIDALDLSPSFIKLHLEGMELAALQGALCTLEAHRPLITATVYHNALGVSAIHKWLMTELCDYDYLFRAHSWCGTGAVVYAIPRERVAR